MAARPPLPRVAQAGEYSWDLYEEKNAKIFVNEFNEVANSRVTVNGVSQPPDGLLLELRKAELMKLMNRAEQGLLESPNKDGWNEWGPAGSNPSMWEIRHEWNKHEQIRIYHGEPRSHPKQLVACGCQIKIYRNNKLTDLIHKIQTNFIRTATHRFELWCLKS